MRRRLPALLCLDLLILSVFMVSSPFLSVSCAAPLGRAWTPGQALLHPQFSSLGSPRLDVDAAGVPIALTRAGSSTAGEIVGFAWSGDHWAATWSISSWSRLLLPSLGPPGDQIIVWTDGKRVPADPTGALSRLYWNQTQNGVASPMDTVGLICNDRFQIAGARSGQRRWVLFNDRQHAVPWGMDLRLLYSNTVGVWHEVPIEGFGDQGTTVSALNDTTALIVWCGIDEGIRWGILTDANWQIGTQNVGFNSLDQGVRLRPRPSGGQWLFWATAQPYMGVGYFHDGVWEPSEALAPNYLDSGPLANHNTQTVDASRDSAEYPVVALWVYNGNTARDEIYVFVPEVSGWPSGEELPNSKGGVWPTTTRDANGDVWVAFWYQYSGVVVWTHTYTKTTCSVPLTTTEAGGGRQVRWTLSEAAPGSWWTVLRVVGNAPGEPIARLQAGAGTEMSCVDFSPSPEGRYRIRRECVDTRYQWLSEISDTPVPAMVSLVSAEASLGEVRLSWYSKAELGSATVSRRSERSDWLELGAPTAEGNGLLTYVDSGLAGGRYAYRLQLGGDVTPEAWVDVPSGFALSLVGLQPNPAVNSMKIAFSLATDDSATLEVYSVKGRCVLRRQVGSLGVGNHVIDLRRDGDIRPGVYWLRLTQLGKTITTKGVLTQ